MPYTVDNMLVLDPEAGGFTTPDPVVWTPPAATAPVMMLFPATSDIRDRCALVSDHWGDAAAIQFIADFYSNAVLWFPCDDCGVDAPFDQDQWEAEGYAHCLICGRSVADAEHSPSRDERHLRLV